MILITGAGGKTGQAIIKQLAQKNVPVRAFVFRPEQTKLVKKLGATEVIVGNMHHLTSCKQAVMGTTAIYHICSNMNPYEVEIGEQMIAAAKWANVSRFVYHSVFRPQIKAMPHHWLKLQVEERLFASGLVVTILQPTAYMQNLRGYWPTIVTEGIYQVPYPVETRLSLVDLADVATVAATVLTEAGHENAVYELISSSAPSQIEIADALSHQLNRPVTAHQQPLAVWERDAQANGLIDYAIETLLKMFRYYANHHFIGNPNVLGWLLKRSPTTFEEFLEKI